jgi:hypothetical protein
VSLLARQKEEYMMRGKFSILIAVAVCFAICAVQSNALYSQSKDITAAELVAKHLNSIAKPDVLAKAKSRGISGAAAVQFIQGFSGQLNDGQFICASEGQNLGMQLKFKDNKYPGEYFAYNGKETTVGQINPGIKSPIADFIFRYNGIMKEGLLGGVLSVAWPLLNNQERQPELDLKQEKVEDKSYYVLEYGSKKSLGNDLRVKLYFDPATFHHVRTEYRVRIKNDMSVLGSVNSAANPSSTSGLGQNDTNRRRPDDLQPRATIQTSQPDNIYVLVEKFGNFGNIGGLVLPQDYSIEYSQEGLATFVARWAVMIEHWIPNRPVDPSFFVAQK